MGEGLWTCEMAVRYKGIMDRDGKCFLATRRPKNPHTYQAYVCYKKCLKIPKG